MSRSVRNFRIVASRLAAAGVVGACAGCWGGHDGDAAGGVVGPAAGVRTPGSLRLDAAWGSLIVAPSARLPAAVASKLDSPEVLAGAHTDDGRPVKVEVRTLRATAGESPLLPPTGRRGWLPPVGVWSVAGEGGLPGSAAPGEGAALVARFAVITMPPGTMGQGVWIGDHRLEVNWLPSSRTVADRLNGLSWGSPLAAGAMDSGVVRAGLDAERTSPFRRWRARMAMGTLTRSEGVGTGHEGEPVDAALPDAFEDPSLELIAAQIEERWAVALARLGEVDAGLYDRVRRALVRTAKIGTAGGGPGGGTTGMVVPTWPTDQVVLDELVTALLTPRLPARLVRDAAERFLEGLPGAVGWITDDAAGVDAATLMPVVAVGATNLTEVPLAASVRWAGGVAGLITPELTPVAAGTTARLTAPSIPTDVARDAGLGVQRLSVRVGDWMGTLHGSPAAIAVQPPGLLMEPLASDWTFGAWTAGAAGEAARVPLAVTLLRTPSPNPRDRELGEGWVVYGQVARGVSGTLRVWIGPAARSRTAIVVNLATVGTAVASAAEEGQKPEPAAEREVRTFSVPLPGDAATKAGGWRLLIGIDADVTVKDGSPVHVAWPRPMFPWETSPSRVALDLAGWGGVAGK